MSSPTIAPAHGASRTIANGEPAASRARLAWIVLSAFALRVAFIRSRPALFLNLCVRRVLLFWCGIPEIWSEDITPRDVLPQWPYVALATMAFAGLAELARRRRGPAWFFAPALLVYPVLYYVTFPGRAVSTSDRAADVDTGGVCGAEQLAVLAG